MSGESRAFALDPSRIDVHVKKKFPRGSVIDSDTEKVRNSVRDDLLALNDNGNKVIREVFFKEDIQRDMHCGSA